MYLKALKLHGFKSFADPSTLGFEPGVTAVVGPNGCGKSNIADAIRWVLGEQSAKALRGGKMQDVIFEGADTRKPSQMCEVSILLTDCEKQLGSQFHEIEITRRVHRGSQSEYFFNNTPCRHKDIQNLFMNTGIGRTSYSIMAQGQIDQILSSKPEERRIVFEEAAGITKYKSQRREALQKLALTDTNLARVSDVIAEVSRQIGSLRRQASKALRYKRVSHRLRHLALAHGGCQHGKITATLTELDGQVIKLRAASETRRVHYSQQQSDLEEKKAHRSRLNQRVQEAQQAVFDLRTERDQTLNTANLAQIKRTGLIERLDAARAALGELEMQLRDLTAQADTSAQDKQLQLSLLGSSEANLQEINRQVAVSEGGLTTLEQELQQSKFQLLQVESTLARLRTDCSGYEVDQKTSVHRHETLLAEIEGIRQQHGAAAQVAAEFELRVEENLAARARAQQEARDAQQAIANRTREFRDAQRRLSEIDRQLTTRTGRLQVLQRLHESFEGFGEGAKALLQGQLDHTLEGAPRPAPIMDGLSFAPEYAKAIEALIGSAAEAVTVADLATAQRILAHLEATQAGSICLRVGELAGNPAPAATSPAPDTPPAESSDRSVRSDSSVHSAPPTLPLGLIPVSSILNTADTAHPVAGLLAACYIAADLAAFLAYWRENPSFPFLAVATRKGEYIDRRGLISGGSMKKNPRSIVQRENEMRETANAVADDQKARDAQKTVCDTISAAITEAETTLQQKRDEELAVSQQTAAIQAEQRNAQRAVEDISSKLRRMEAESVSVEAARTEAHARWEKAQTQLTEAETLHDQGKERIRQMETRITELRADRDTKRESLNAARLAASEQRGKVDYLERGMADMERRRAELGALLVQRQQEIELWTQQIQDLEGETAAKRARAATLEETIAVAQQQVEQIRVQLVEVEHQITGVEGTQDNLRVEAEKAHDEFSKCEVKLAESRARADFLKEEVEREFQTDITTLDWKNLLWHADDEPEGIENLDLDDDDPAADPTADTPAADTPPAESSARSDSSVRSVRSDSPDRSTTTTAAPAEDQSATAPATTADDATTITATTDTDAAPAPTTSSAADVPTPDAQPAAAAAEPAKQQRRRRKQKQKGDPTEEDLAALDNTNWDQVRSDIASLRQRINSMGDVNLVAIEEYRSLKQRYDFLKTQNDDLVNAKTELLKTIDEINNTSMQQFQITFDQIKKNFDYTFTKLFGGGKAALDLVQADDPLESGIEITAQPPGTKLKGISLLSGGQKTLTAVALLFALYMVKPSPFCLLDELDAPLDESNIGRFTDLLANFTNDSQFIIITHNKRTVAAADAIYGVTMEERGVSKTVSMRFNKELGDAEVQKGANDTIAEAVRSTKV
ncbi:MAG: chromosome segregation protein SMC [Opitutaceae bacterium]|jgi:chromosome segregation protein|nr:chromosome segregation protein SMC [Opitutaceae bacterium]